LIYINKNEPTTSDVTNISDPRDTSYGNIIYTLRRVWRYQRGNQNPYIKEE